MTLNEYIEEISKLNEAEIFYKQYSEAKMNKETLKDFLNNLDMKLVENKHYIIPELPETMPPCMMDEYIITSNDKGLLVQKHNRYSPSFLHFHTFFECIYVYEGTCLNTYNGKEMLMKEGDLAIMPPNASHSLSVFDNSIIFNLIISRDAIVNTFRNSLFYKDNELSNFFINNISFKANTGMFYVRTYQDEEIKMLILKMGLESKNKFPESDAILNGSFSILFGLIIRYYRNNSTIEGNNSYKNDKLNRMIIYIQEHHTNIKLSDLAHEFNYTNEYVSKFIKDNTGKSFINIVIEAKLKHAIILLETTTLSLENIAYQIGYQNIENFIRTFKKVYKLTPSEYRKNVNIGSL